MKFRPLLTFFAAAFVLSAQAEEPAAAAAATPEKSDAAAAKTPAKPDAAATAREALGKQESDVDQAELLKSTLTAVDKQYTMIKRGTSQLTYGLNYTYIGQDRINTDLSSGTATLFSIENDNSHTITNTLSLDYGLRDNLTANVTIPMVSKYAKTATVDGVTHSVGDISLGVRLQPFEAKPDTPSLTVSTSIRVPTGTSPYKVISGSGLAVGSGTTGISAGVNVSKVVDPVALFGSFTLNYSRPAEDLKQVLNSAILTRVEPGLGFGFGFGFAYALSYAITTSFSFQESISRGSRLFFENGQNVTTNSQTSGILNLGIGYRISPKTTINTSVGIGLTTNSPNLTLDVSLPLSL